MGFRDIVFPVLMGSITLLRAARAARALGRPAALIAVVSTCLPRRAGGTFLGSH
jgi:hypothetical protein